MRVDGNVEGTETVEVTLTSSDFTVGPINKVVISILDDDREFTNYIMWNTIISMCQCRYHIGALCH